MPLAVRGTVMGPWLAATLHRHFTSTVPLFCVQPAVNVSCVSRVSSRLPVQQKRPSHKEPGYRPWLDFMFQKGRVPR